MATERVEVEIRVPCVEGQEHPVRLAFTAWGEFEVVWNPCTEALGVFGAMAPCSAWLRAWRANFGAEEYVSYRLAVAEALGKIGVAAVPALCQALSDGRWKVRSAVAWALGNIGDPQAVPALLERLGDESKWVRRAVAEALGEIGDPQAVPRLCQALSDWHSDVRWAAAEALGEMGAPQAVPYLCQALNDADWNVRKAVARALGAIGDPQAVPYLQQALEREWNWFARSAIQEAIEQIQRRG